MGFNSAVGDGGEGGLRWGGVPTNRDASQALGVQNVARAAHKHAGLGTWDEPPVHRFAHARQALRLVRVRIVPATEAKGSGQCRETWAKGKGGWTSPHATGGRCAGKPDSLTSA
jgi:hypothetical protein